MKVVISNAASEPIYEQIARQIKAQIIAGDLKESHELPSIRKLAKELQISVITTKRAYDELEKEGFVDSVVGKGSFVAMQNKELLREKRIKTVEEMMAEMVDEAHKLNITFPELEEMLQILYHNKKEE